MKLRGVLKKLVVAIVTGVVVNSLANAIFPKKEFSLFPTLSAMSVVIASGSSSYSLYKNVLLSNLVYAATCLAEFKLGVSLVSLPLFAATLSLVATNKTVNVSRSLIGVSNFPRLEKIYSESKLRKKIGLLKEKVKTLEINVACEEDLRLVEQIIRTRKFVAYKENNSIKLLYEYYENLPNFGSESIKKVRGKKVDNELILNEIYEKASPSFPSLILPFEEKRVKVPSNYSKGKLVILDQEGKINLHKLKKINEKAGWVELGENPIVNFVKRRLFSGRVTFSIITRNEQRSGADLTIFIKKDFQEKEVSNVVISVPKHTEKLGKYVGFENLEPFNNSIILYSQEDDLLFLLKGDQK